MKIRIKTRRPEEIWHRWLIHRAQSHLRKGRFHFCQYLFVTLNRLLKAKKPQDSEIPYLNTENDKRHSKAKIL